MKINHLKKSAALLISACILVPALNSKSIFADSPIFSLPAETPKQNAKHLKSNGIVYNFIKEPGYVSLGEVHVGNNRDINISDIVIPNAITVNGKSYAVTGIEKNAFSSNKNIKSVSFGISVKSVAPSAFINCPNLKEFNVSEDSRHFFSEDGVLYDAGQKNLIKYPEAKDSSSYSVNSKTEEISEYAFFGCSGLKDVFLGENTVKTGSYAFAGCKNLSSVSMGNLMETIGDYAFFQTGLKSIIFSRTMNEIGEAAFAFTNLLSVTIPDNVSEIKYGTFYECSNLTSASLSSHLSSIDEYAFAKTGLKNITIPNSVSEIKSSAFSDCTSLKTAYLGGGLTTIGDRAFYNCSLIKTIDIPNSLAVLGKDVFAGCTNLESISAKKGNPNFSTKDNALYDKKETTLIYFPPANYSLKYTLPSSLLKIEDNAFADCRYINEFELESDVHFYVEDGILYDDLQKTLIRFPMGKDIPNFNIPDGVEKIESKAFKNTSISGVINIPYTIKEIEENAFDGCKNITSYNVSSENLYFSSENGVLYNADKTELIKYPEASSAKSFKVPDSVIKIHAGAFKSSKLKTITLGQNLEVIGDAAFSDTNINEIILPESLKEIGEYAFSGTRLSEITFPASVKSIGGYAFKDCSSLKTVRFAENKRPETLGVNIFLNCPFAEIHVSDSSSDSYLPMIFSLNIE